MFGRRLKANKPDYHIRVNGLKVPVYKTPFTKETYQQMVMDDKFDRFAISDQQKGKIKFYSFRDRNIPSYNVLFGNGVDIGLTSVAKIMIVVVMGVWAIRLSRFSLGFASLFPKNRKPVKDILNDISEYENILNWKSPEKGGAAHNGAPPETPEVEYEYKEE